MIVFTRTNIVLPLAVASLLACGGDKLQSTAHVDPLPPSGDPLEIRYTEVAARDGIVYLGTASNGLSVIDPAKEEKKKKGVEIARLDPGQMVRSVAVGGRWLVLALNIGITIYDISEARKPTARTQFSSTAMKQCQSVFVHDDIVYCATGTTDAPHLVLVKLTRPATGIQAVELGTFTLPLTPAEQQTEWVAAHDVFVHGRDGKKIAYVAYWERGLQILDVTDPLKPALLGGAPMRGWSQSVWVEGRFAYVAEENYRGPVRVYDVSNLASPTAVGTLHSRRGEAIAANRVHVHKGFVFAAWHQDGLRIFQAKGADKPEEFAHFDTWNEASNGTNPVVSQYAGAADVYVESDDRVFVSDMQTGLWALSFSSGGGDTEIKRSGNSVFAKEGRPPIGIGTPRPPAIRTGRPIAVQVPIKSVDYYFPLSDEIALGGSPTITLQGVAQATEIAPGPFPAARDTAWLQRSFTLADDATGSTSLRVTFNDEGSERQMQMNIPVLPRAAPNTDTEPNDHYGVAVDAMPSAAWVATVKGTLSVPDRTDVYLVQGGSKVYNVRVAAPERSTDKSQPAVRVAVNSTGEAQTHPDTTQSVVPYSDVQNRDLKLEIVLSSSIATGNFYVVITNLDTTVTDVPYKVDAVGR